MEDTKKIPAMSISLLALGFINVYFRCISFKIWIWFFFSNEREFNPTQRENLQEIMLVIVK